MRIALATPTFPRSIDDAVAQVERDLAIAAARGASLVCFPESFVPGFRGIDEPVAPHDPAALAAALARIQGAARRARCGAIVAMDHDDGGRILNVATVIGADGEVRGMQTKNQLDPSEDTIFVPGTTRQLFELDGLVFGVAICHEGFRYPESVRWAASRGAQIVFHPHCTGSNRVGTRPTAWQGAGNAYYEHAMMCRALENTIYFASVNYGFTYQESASCVVDPAGKLVAMQPYGEPGVLVTELDLSRATGALARRFKPELYV